VSQRGDRAAIAQLQFQGGSFDDPSRIRTMTGYRRATQRARVHVHTIREVARLALRLEGPLPSEPEHAPGGNRLVRMREDRPEAVDLSVRFGGFETWSTDRVCWHAPSGRSRSSSDTYARPRTKGDSEA
jgi:hypothetical protein